MPSKGIAHHKNVKPILKTQTKSIHIRKETFNIIDKEAKKLNISKVQMVNIMVNFYLRNFIIVEQLSLSSKEII